MKLTVPVTAFAVAEPFRVAVAVVMLLAASVLAAGGVAVVKLSTEPEAEPFTVTTFAR